eukprot:2226605-Karenia_brevis.AAC.1
MAVGCDPGGILVPRAHCKRSPLQEISPASDLASVQLVLASYRAWGSNGAAAAALLCCLLVTVGVLVLGSGAPSH